MLLLQVMPVAVVSKDKLQEKIELFYLVCLNPDKTLYLSLIKLLKNEFE